MFDTCYWRKSSWRVFLEALALLSHPTAPSFPWGCPLPWQTQHMVLHLLPCAWRQQQQDSASSTETQLLLPDVTAVRPSRPWGYCSRNVPFRNTILQLPIPKTAGALFAWEKKIKKGKKKATYTHKEKKI